MGELIEQGLIKAWGLSNETTFGVCKWCAVWCRHEVAARSGAQKDGRSVTHLPLPRRCSTAERLGLPKPVSIQNDFSLLVRARGAPLPALNIRRCHPW